VPGGTAQTKIFSTDQKGLGTNSNLVRLGNARWNIRFSCTVVRQIGNPNQSHMTHALNTACVFSCRWLQEHTARHCKTLHHTAPHCITLQHTACVFFYRRLQYHTATHCNTLHHTAIHSLRFLLPVVATTASTFSFEKEGPHMCFSLCCVVLQC